MDNPAHRLIWIDLEMTGLEPETDVIIEIATVVTDSDLNIIAVGPDIALSQTQQTMDAMDEWCTNQHGKSGLTQRVLDSKIDCAEAERQTIEFLKQHIAPGVSPICGNSIGQDKRFLVKYMPNLAEYFHYRSIDVSSLKELARRWAPEVLAGVTKTGDHLALNDIYDSINELKHYRKHFLK